MGYPYLIAAVSLLFRVPTSVALWVIAVAGCVASVWLTARLFGTTVAGYFAFTNFAWLQVSYLGGSEPLALALGLGSLLAFRRDRIVVSALLASLAVTVRALMFFALVGIGLVLIYRNKFWQFLATLGIGLGIGSLYSIAISPRVRAEVSNGIRADLAKLGGDSVLVHPFPRHLGFHTDLEVADLPKKILS